MVDLRELILKVSQAKDKQELQSLKSEFLGKNSQINQEFKKLGSLPEDQKKDILTGLLKVIYQLNKAGVITIQRMCYTCSYYQHENNEHFCNLLQSKLASKELRIDCPEHEFKS